MSFVQNTGICKSWEFLVVRPLTSPRVRNFDGKWERSLQSYTWKQAGLRHWIIVAVLSCKTRDACAIVVIDYEYRLKKRIYAKKKKVFILNVFKIEQSTPCPCFIDRRKHGFMVAVVRSSIRAIKILLFFRHHVGCLLWNLYSSCINFQSTRWAFMYPHLCGTNYCEIPVVIGAGFRRQNCCALPVSFDKRSVPQTRSAQIVF